MSKRNIKKLEVTRQLQPYLSLLDTMPGQDCDPEQASVSGSSAPSSGQSQYPSLIQSFGISCISPAFHPVAHFRAVTDEVVKVMTRRHRDSSTLVLRNLKVSPYRPMLSILSCSSCNQSLAKHKQRLFSSLGLVVLMMQSRHKSGNKGQVTHRQIVVCSEVLPRSDLTGVIAGAGCTRLGWY